MSRHRDYSSRVLTALLAAAALFLAARIGFGARVSGGGLNFAAACGADDRLVKSSGTGALECSGIAVDDSNNMSGIGTIGSGAITSTGEIEGAGIVESAGSGLQITRAVASVGTAALHASGAATAALQLHDSNATSGERRWNMTNSGGVCTIDVTDDVDDANVVANIFNIPLATGNIGIGAAPGTSKVLVSDGTNTLIEFLDSGTTSTIRFGGDADETATSAPASGWTFNTGSGNAYIVQAGGVEIARLNATALTLGTGVGVIVPDGAYLRSADNNAGAPAAGDCDAAAELGRFSIDTTNNRLYICNGATRLWDFIALTD